MRTVHPLPTRDSQWGDMVGVSVRYVEPPHVSGGGRRPHRSSPRFAPGLSWDWPKVTVDPGRKRTESGESDP